MGFAINELQNPLHINKGGCKMRHVHGLYFRKITVSLNEPLQPAPQVFATDFQVRVKHLIAHVRNFYMS